jgi:uridine phosphorylase
MKIINKKKAIFIRVGSCGSLQKFIKLGDVIISTASVRLENTSLFYVPVGYPAVADYTVVNALVKTAEKFRYRHHVGMTATTSSFYGAQCRNVGFILKFPKLIEELSEIGVLNLEMETSALFTFCSLQNIRAGAICAVYTDRIHDSVIEPIDKEKVDDVCIKTALNALKILIN